MTYILNFTAAANVFKGALKGGQCHPMPRLWTHPWVWRPSRKFWGYALHFLQSDVFCIELWWKTQMNAWHQFNYQTFCGILKQVFSTFHIYYDPCWVSTHVWMFFVVFCVQLFSNVRVKVQQGDNFVWFQAAFLLALYIWWVHHFIVLCECIVILYTAYLCTWSISK